MARKRQWKQAREILCVRLDSIGDVLMTTPAIRALKDSGRNRPSRCSPPRRARRLPVSCPRSTTSSSTMPRG